jgi:PAS domain S-box-containing protein
MTAAVANGPTAVPAGTAEDLGVRERLEAALAASEIGTFRWDPAEDRLDWDATLKALYGLAPDAEVRRVDDFLSHVHPDDREALIGEVRRCIDERVPLVKEFRILLPDGSVRWISDKARAVYDGQGRLVCITGACRDVTDRKVVEERLAAALAEKESLLSQKEFLLKEVNHRVKNSLQLVSSLLTIQGGFLAEEDARRAFQEARSRLKAVAHIHERLYRTDDARTIEFGCYLDELCRDLAAALGAEAPGRLEVAAERATVSVESAIALALIANELVTNAVKYAYPEGTPGSVRVSFSAPPGGSGRLVVEDDGVGLPKGFPDKGTVGLGMTLVTMLIRQLHGRLSIEPKERGARFVVTLP